MKTYTITLHFSQNCGSSLQSYALQKFLRNHYIDNEIINYCPKYKASFFLKLKNIVKYILYRKSIISQKKKFIQFNNDNLLLTRKKFLTNEELIRQEFECDAMITGSDQLWNDMYDCGKDLSYYLNFCNSNKIAYSVSLGRKNVSFDNLEMIKDNCNDFKLISLREETNVDQIKSILPCVNVKYACDPTLLLNCNEYENICCKRLFDFEYIFIYLAQDIESKKISSIMKRVHEEYPNIKIIYSGTFFARCKCDYHIKDISPSEFLSLIKYSKFVVCNSFHASVFSILFNKEFGVSLPLENGDRITSLLDSLGIEYINVNSLIFLRNINYAVVNEKLELIKKNSKQLLLEALK